MPIVSHVTNDSLYPGQSTRLYSLISSANFPNNLTFPQCHKNFFKKYYFYRFHSYWCLILRFDLSFKAYYLLHKSYCSFPKLWLQYITNLLRSKDEILIQDRTILNHKISLLQNTFKKHTYMSPTYACTQVYICAGIDIINPILFPSPTWKNSSILRYSLF